MSRAPFALGAVVVPARNGALRGLGYDLDALGTRALGLVIESRASKALVSFPEINVSLWIPHDEMADAAVEAAAGREGFAALLPDWSGDRTGIEFVWWVSELCSLLDVRFVLGLETGELIEIWDQEDAPLDHYYQGDINVPAAYVGLGIEEFFPETWKKVEELLGTRLLFSRLLPSSMKKMEVALYLRKDV
jgi:hypothetical protein